MTPKTLPVLFRAAHSNGRRRYFPKTIYCNVCLTFESDAPDFGIT